MLEAYNALHNYDIICISETYLNYSLTDDDPTLKLKDYELAQKGGQVPPRARQISNGTKSKPRYRGFRKTMVNSPSPERQSIRALHQSNFTP